MRVLRRSWSNTVAGIHHHNVQCRATAPHRQPPHATQRMRGEVTRRARTQATGTHAGLYTIPRLLSPLKFVVVRTRKRESHREPDFEANLGFGMKPVRRTNEIKRVLSPSLPKVSRPKSCTGDHHASRQSLGRCSPTLSPREVVMPYGSRLPLCPSSICKSESHTIFAPWRPANSVSSLGPQLSFR